MIYCFLIPAKYDGTELMTKMWRRAVIPAARRHLSLLQAQIREGADFGEMLTPPDGGADKVLIEDSPETV